MGVTVAQVEFMGEFVGTTIAFGKPDTEPLLGVTALESAGIEGGPSQPDPNTAAGSAAQGISIEAISGPEHPLHEEADRQYE